MEVPYLKYIRSYWKETQLFLPSDEEFRKFGLSGTICVFGYVIMDKGDHYEIGQKEMMTFHDDETFEFIQGDISIKYEGKKIEIFRERAKAFDEFMNKVQMYVKNFWTEKAIEDLNTQETETVQEIL